MADLLQQPAKRALIPDLKFFHQFVRALFFHRRKFLRSVLISAFKQELEKRDVDEVLEDSQFNGEMRAEQLTTGEIQLLCEGFRRKLAQDD